MPYQIPNPSQRVNQVNAINLWNRLEPRPRTGEFNRSLRAEIRDACWMLCRQWHMDEFKAENRVSPAFAQINIETTRLHQYLPTGSPEVANPAVQAYNDTIPLEVMVEREPIPQDNKLRLQMAHYWMKLIAKNNLNQPEKLSNALREAYPIELLVDVDVPDDNQPPPNPNYSIEYGKSISLKPERQMLQVATGRSFNAIAFYAALLDDAEAVKSFLAATSVYSGTTDLDADFDTLVNTLLPLFSAWYARIYSQPEAVSAWSDKNMEHKFKVASPALDDLGETPRVLLADEYAGGRLDWYSFDSQSAEVTNNLMVSQQENFTNETQINTSNLVAFMPSELQYAGIPNARWWEFEERKLNLGKMVADTADFGRLLFMDFMFTYTNDWFSFSHPVDVGSISKVKSLIVTDVFGQKHDIKPAGSGTVAEENDWGSWSMFTVNERGNYKRSEMISFIPPALVNSLESDPIEKVNFLRDEMANLAWAVEQVIPDNVGGGVNGHEAAMAFEEYLKSKAEPVPDSVATDAKYKYKLTTTVPENWMPLIPKKITGSDREIELQLGAMTRNVEGLEVSPLDLAVDPRGRLLESIENSPNSSIYEEEVPRAGAVVTRTYQRARWYNGKTFVWIGKQKRTGHGEGDSGLLFDQLKPVSEENQA